MVSINYLQLLLSLVAGSNVLAGIIFLYTARNLPANERKLYLYFSMMCFALAIQLALDAQFYYMSTVTDTGIVMAKMSVSAGFLFNFFLVLFVAEYTYYKPRRVLLLLTSSLGVFCVANWFFPVTIFDKHVYGMEPYIMSWGEVIYFANLETSNWALPILGLVICMFAYFCRATFLQFKHGQIRDSIMLAIPVAICIVMTFRDLLIDIVKKPGIFLTEFSFFGIILAMSLNLSKKIVESVQIKKELIKNEKRWRTLLEKVQLLVVGLDQHGNANYVNPCYLNVTGFREADVLGKPLANVIAQSDRQKLSELLDLSKNGQTQPSHKNKIITQAGKNRIIAWSNVALFNREGGFIGTLSVGADITDREEAFHEIRGLKDRLLEENVYLQEEIILDHNHRDIIGKSDALKYALMRVEQVAPTDTTVLIEGETGVGKELFARAIHHSSAFKNRPLVKVNCAAIPTNLVESELFGHVKGAYTGADINRIGRFELAQGGTIFLDEIGELPYELQAKLLRVLEDGEFERLGSNQTIKVNVRVIAATNRVLKEEVAAGRFREDLYYRISGYTVSIPSLRKRKDDILPLVENFVDKFNRKLGKRIEKIPKHTQDMLLNYSWPGNVRELRNVIERGVIATSGSKLHLPERLESPAPTTVDDDRNDMRSLEEVERRHIVKILEETRGKISGEGGAAVILGMHPNTLRFRMQKLGIKRTA